MAIKTFELKQVIEQIDKLANVSIHRSGFDKDYYYLRFEKYDNGLWRYHIYKYPKKYLFQVWKETTDKNINEYIR